MTDELSQSLVYAALPRRQMRIAQLGDGTVGADGLFDCCGVVVCAGLQHSAGAGAVTPRLLLLRPAHCGTLLPVDWGRSRSQPAQVSGTASDNGFSSLTCPPLTWRAREHFWAWSCAAVRRPSTSCHRAPTSKVRPHLALSLGALAGVLSINW